MPSGAAARSQQIHVGDRLLSCNGISLRNVSQSKCLSILKSEGNSGDLELELLRPKENEDQLEISLKVSKRDSTVTLHSPSQQRKNFIADIPQSDSDNEVVLSKFQYIDNTCVDGDLRINNQTIDSVNVQSSKEFERHNSDHTKFKSMSSNMEDSDTWVPPPMEFSTYGPAVPPPAEFSEGQSPIFNQSNNGIPVTNIDEIINSYGPVVHSQDGYIPQTDTDNSAGQIKHLEPLPGLHREENGSLDNSLTNSDELGQEGLDMMDSYRGDNGISSKEDLEEGGWEGYDVDAEPFIPPAPVNTDEFKFDDKHSDEDDEIIVPVTVQRQKHIPFMSSVNVPAAGPSEIEEEQIVPAVEERRRIPPSATIKLEERPFEDPQSKPIPQPRLKPTVISVEHSSVPPSSTMSEELAVEEEIVSAEFKERQSGNEQFLQKLGGEVEEEIVPMEAKREQAWNAAKLAVITNAWSKSAGKNKEGEKKNLKSVINVMNVSKKQEGSNKAEVEIETMETVRNVEKSEDVPREEGVHKNVIRVTAPAPDEITNKIIEPSTMGDESMKVDNKSDSVSTGQDTVDIVPLTISSPPPPIVTKVNVEVSETETVPESSAKTKPALESPSPSVLKPTTEGNASAPKPTEVSPPSPLKSSVGMTKPSSLLSTIRSQSSSSSATLKPLSSIRPITVTSKTFSLGKPAGLSGSLSSGRTSLLSTIHGTSTSTKSTRSEEEPFLVSVLKGILGVGMKVSTTPEGWVRVDEIQSSGPIAKDGNIR